MKNLWVDFGSYGFSAVVGFIQARGDVPGWRIRLKSTNGMWQQEGTALEIAEKIVERARAMGIVQNRGDERFVRRQFYKALENAYNQQMCAWRDTLIRHAKRLLGDRGGHR